MLQHVYHAVQTSTGINQVEVTSSIPTELVKPNITQAQEKNHLLDMFSVITENIGQGRTFSENTQLSVNESFYLGALLVVNTLVLIAVIFLLWTPQLRFCSLFGNCDSTSGEYPAGVGHNLQDPRMINNYNMYPTTSYARSLQKRSLEYMGPILKTLAAAYDQYDHRATKD